MAKDRATLRAIHERETAAIIAKENKRRDANRKKWEAEQRRSAETRRAS